MDRESRAHFIEIEPGVFEATSLANLCGPLPDPGGRPATACAACRSPANTCSRQRFSGGGDKPITPGDLDGGHERLCKLVECLLSERGVLQFLKERGVDSSALQKCIEAYCRAEPRAPKSGRRSPACGCSRSETVWRN
jgi:hypothetical protein